MEPERDVVLFDGGCALSDRVVRFIIAHDHGGRFRFAPHASTIGRMLRAHHQVPGDVDGIVLIEDGRARLASSAALRIVRRLGFPWIGLYALAAVPRIVRDALLRGVTYQRRRWFEAASPAAPSAAGRALM